jgi:hypothetical protein
MTFKAVSWSRCRRAHLTSDPERAMTALCGAIFFPRKDLRVTSIQGATLPLCERCVGDAIDLGALAVTQTITKKERKR